MPFTYQKTRIICFLAATSIGCILIMSGTALVFKSNSFRQTSSKSIRTVVIYQLDQYSGKKKDRPIPLKATLRLETTSPLHSSAKAVESAASEQDSDATEVFSNKSDEVLEGGKKHEAKKSSKSVEKQLIPKGNYLREIYLELPEDFTYHNGDDLRTIFPPQVWVHYYGDSLTMQYDFYKITQWEERGNFGFLEMMTEGVTHRKTTISLPKRVILRASADKNVSNLIQSIYLE